LAVTVPLLDLRREHTVIGEEVQAAWADALGSMHLLRGPHLAAFEDEIAAYLGVPAACGVASGTDALLLGIMSLDIGRHDEVIRNTEALEFEYVHPSQRSYK
jgi:dTDP-4-amino-4,6-dideoxygalactose transaminase